MKIPGLRDASEFSHDLPEGVYLVKVGKAGYRRRGPMLLPSMKRRDQICERLTARS